MRKLIMGIFERFRSEEPKEVKLRILVSDFEKEEELESLIKEYVGLSAKLFGITHDYSIDMTTDINKPKIQENPELKQKVEEYQTAHTRQTEIEAEYGDRLREYLEPYAKLPNPNNGFGVDQDEYDHWRMAYTLDKIKERKEQKEKGEDQPAKPKEADTRPEASSVEIDPEMDAKIKDLSKMFHKKYIANTSRAEMSELKRQIKEFESNQQLIDDLREYIKRYENTRNLPWHITLLKVALDDVGKSRKWF